MKKTIITLVAAATLFAAAAPVATTVYANQTASDNINNSYTVNDYLAAQKKADDAKAAAEKFEKETLKPLKVEKNSLSVLINTNEAKILAAQETILKYASIKDDTATNGKVLYDQAVKDLEELNTTNAAARTKLIAVEIQITAAESRLAELKNQADAAQKEADRIKGLIGKPKTSNGVAPTGNPTTPSTPNTAGQPEASKPAAPAAAQTATGAKTLPKTSAVK